MFGLDGQEKQPFAKEVVDSRVQLLGIEELVDDHYARDHFLRLLGFPWGAVRAVRDVCVNDKEEW